MAKSWSLFTLAVLSLASKSRAACDDIDQYLDIPSPLTEDKVIYLDSVGQIVCEELDAEEGLLEEVIIVGPHTLTLKSSGTVSFVNLGFTVTSGANLVFDMPDTHFGPNSEGFHRTNYHTYVVEVDGSSSATFNGNVVATDVSNVASIFANSGMLAIGGSAIFEGGSNVFYVNTGTVSFAGDATFKDHRYLAVRNDESGYVSFSKDVVFDNNAYNFDGASGCSAANDEADTEMVFKGDVVFRNNDCGEGVAMYNEGTMTFHGEVLFEDNEGGYDGGAVENSAGSIEFKQAVAFNNNDADGYYGGGIAVKGGDVRFKESVTFDGNLADSGAAFAVLGGSLTFEKPSVVTFSNGQISEDSDEMDGNCLIGYVEDGGTVVGFPGDDVCDSADN